MASGFAPALQQFDDLLHTGWTSFLAAAHDAERSDQAFKDPLPSRSREPYRSRRCGDSSDAVDCDPAHLAHLVVQMHVHMFPQNRLSLAHLRHVQQSICDLSKDQEMVRVSDMKVNGNGNGKEMSVYVVFVLTVFRLIVERMAEEEEEADGVISVDVFDLVEGMLLGIVRARCVDLGVLYGPIAVFVRRLRLKSKVERLPMLGLDLDLRSLARHGVCEHRATALLNAVCEGCEDIGVNEANKLLALSEELLMSAKGARPKTKALVIESMLPCIASRGREVVTASLAGFTKNMWKYLSSRMEHEEDMAVLVGLVHGLRKHRDILKRIFQDPYLWETLLVFMNGRQSGIEQKRAGFLARAGVDILEPKDKRWSQLLCVCDSMSEFEIHLVESAWEGVQGLLRRATSTSATATGFPVEFSSTWAALAISKGLHNANPSVRKLTIISVLRLGASIDYATHEALPIAFISDEILPALNAPELYRVSTSADAVTVDELAIEDKLGAFCNAWYNSLPVEGTTRSYGIQRLLATAPKLDAKIHQMLALFSAIGQLEPSPSATAAIRVEELDLFRTMIVRLHSQLTSDMLRKRSNKLLRSMAECIGKHLRVDEASSTAALSWICMVVLEVPQSVLTVDILRPLGKLLETHEVFHAALLEMVETCLEANIDPRRTSLALLLASTSQDSRLSAATSTALQPLVSEIGVLYSRPYTPAHRKRCSVSLLGETLRLYRLIGVSPTLPIAEWAGPIELFSFCEQQLLAVLGSNGSTALLEEALVEGGFRRVAVEDSQVSLASKCIIVLRELQLAAHPAASACATTLRRAAVETLESTHDLVRSTQALTVLAATTEMYTGSNTEMESLLLCVLNDEGLEWEAREAHDGGSSKLTKSSVISRREAVRWDVVFHLCQDSSATVELQPDLVQSLSERCCSGIAASSDRSTSQKIFSVSAALGIQACFHPNTFAAAQAAFVDGGIADFEDANSTEFDRDELTARLGLYLDGIKEQLKSPESGAIDAVAAYIKLAFHPAVMVISGVDDAVLRPAWDAFERAFVNGQPAAFCALIRHCVANVWTHHAVCTLHWADEISRALRVRQDRSGFCSQDLLLDAHTASAAAYPRVALAAFLCRSPARDIVSLLIRQTASPKLEACKCMPQSDAYYEQLHIWQTLACLANPEISNFDDVDGSLFHCALDAVNRGFLPEIRQLIDLTLVNCVLCRPKALLPLILAQARDPKLSNATASSIMIDIMLILKHVAASEVPVMDVLRAVTPSATSPNGLVRIAAQHTLRAMLDRFGAQAAAEDAVWRNVRRHLCENKELVKMFARQEAWVQAYDPRKQATIHKLMIEGQSIFGEVHPKAVVYEMKQAMKQVFDEFRDQHEQWVPRDQPARSKDKRSERRTLAKAVAEEEDVDSLQYKIKPWEDCFDLMLPLSQPESRETSSAYPSGTKSKRSVNGVQEDARKKVAAERIKQPLVVVGSLLDKVPNLGGLCRTCEIFSVEEYVVPNLSLAKNGTFKSVSIQAAEWMKLSEVVPNDLHTYLVQMKSKGYQIVALEQTSTSIPLQDFTLPPDAKVVLLLGIESEGIPASLLQVVDVCVEIPQYGVLRSLNVHVSGSIFIWEYTKQRLLKDVATVAA